MALYTKMEGLSWRNHVVGCMRAPASPCHKFSLSLSCKSKFLYCQCVNAYSGLLSALKYRNTTALNNNRMERSSSIDDWRGGMRACSYSPICLSQGFHLSIVCWAGQAGRHEARKKGNRGIRLNGLKNAVPVCYARTASPVVR